MANTSASIRISDHISSSDEEERTPGYGATPRWTLPSNLPQLKYGKYTDPEEFVEAFERVMEAHGIPEARYVKLIKMCLDAIDNLSCYVFGLSR